MEYLVDEKQLRRLCKKVFCHLGVDELHAGVAADLLVLADLRGVYSHGVCRIPEYVRRVKAGGATVSADISVLRETPTTAALDAHHSLGAIAAYDAAMLARKKAQENGIAFVTIKNSNHYGMAGYWSLLLAGNDMIGFSASDSDPCLATHGGSTATVGNNPFSYAFSGKKYRDICFDVACSMVAGGKKGRMIARGERMPLGWFLDLEGRDTDDPALGITALPFGGHKGSGLSFVMEVLTSRLAGGSFGRDMGSFWNSPVENILTSHCFAAIHVDAFQDIADFQKGIDDYVDYIKASPRQTGVEEILYPGELESRNVLRYRAQGIPIEENVLDTLYHEGVQAGLSESELAFLKAISRED